MIYVRACRKPFKGHFSGLLVHKDKAVKSLSGLFKQGSSKLITVGLGDSLNDLPMLEVVYRAVLTKNTMGNKTIGCSLEILRFLMK